MEWKLIDGEWWLMDDKGGQIILAHTYLNNKFWAVYNGKNDHLVRLEDYMMNRGINMEDVNQVKEFVSEGWQIKRMIENE